MLRAIFFLSLVCAQAQSLVPGDYRSSMIVDGRVRTYAVHVPPAARCQTLTPLVLFFHGGGGNGTQAANSYQMNPIADREGFFAVYPDGTGNLPALGIFTWNSGHCCGYAYENKVDDVGFVRALITALRSAYPVDPNRIYATGFSNGAMMSHRLAAELSTTFAAVAPISGAIGGTTEGVSYTIPQPAAPVPILMLHGRLDQNVPYNGGIGAESVIFNRDEKSVAEGIAFWTAANRCRPAPTSSRSGNVAVDAYTGCANGADVTLYTIDNGAHGWPGGRVPAQLGGDTPVYELSASELVWSFFEAHPRAAAPAGPQGDAPWIAPGGITNAASFRKGPIAPGELLTIFGANLGPDGTEVLFDGIPGPLYYSFAGQVSAFVPYAAAQKQCTSVQVSRNGRLSDPVRVPVAGAQPALFSRDFSGAGPGVIFNQNSSVNSAANPAQRGTIVAMYLTGEGQTIPAGVDGRLGGPVPTSPVLPVSVYMNGVQADVIYAGGVFGTAAGIFQVNARVPLSVPASDAVSVIVNVGGAATPFGVTLSVR
jgi:polyhydroxybutyrate depolymerase